MTLRILSVLLGLTISSAAMAQEYGLQLGLHQTTAAVDVGQTGATGSVSGKLGFNAGLAVAFELVPNLRFRTGFQYDQREFDYKENTQGKIQFNFSYFDVPIMAQYSFNPMVAIYGGLIAGIKSSDSTSSPSTFSGAKTDMKSLYPLLQVGANFTFDDMIGFDLYYERGMGEFATYKPLTTSSSEISLKDYSTVGMHFLYWF